MSKLNLFLLGPPRVQVDQRYLEITRRKTLALLVYLAGSGERQQRETLATLLWPGLDQRQARAALRRSLSDLNKRLGKGWLAADRESVGLDQEAEVWLDVAQFQQRLADCQSHGHVPAEVCPACLEPLTAAVSLYRADFLTGFTLPDCPEFDEWQFFQAEGLRQNFAAALERLIRLHSGEGDPAASLETAIAYARRWLALDPLHEPAHRQLMELYALTGQQAAALRQYQLCRQTLDDELGVPPSEETTALSERIRTGKYGRGAGERGSGGEREPEAEKQSSPAVSGPTVICHNLPAQTTPFIGREDELAALDALLKGVERRLITIVGPGGMGKTRLALAAAERQLQQPPTNSPQREEDATTSPLGGTEGGLFPNGVFFVSLAPLSEVEHIVPAIAEAMGYDLEAEGQTSRTQHQQLLGYLRQRQLLLLLDNFEHLLDGVALVADILQAAPEVHILATSRERLHLHEEQLFPIQGLEFPDWETPEDAATYTAVKLFIQSAQRVQPRFELVADDLTYLTRICRLVEGMPLGIELAAAWVDLLSLADIAAEIQTSLDFLETEARNVPDRQRSIRAVFDSSWGRMSEGEQRVFAQFSVFRGGFTRQAAQAVAGASLRLLSHLASKSLLQYDKTADRYQIHELLRQYAAEKLEIAGQIEAARDAHAAYFADFLQQQETDLKGRRQRQAQSEIEADFENVRRAWLWSLERIDYQTIERAMEGLYWFLYGDPHRFQEGKSLFNTGRETLAPPENEAPHPIWGKVLARVLPYGHGHFDTPTQAKAWLEQALTIAEANDDEAELAFCRWLLGQIKVTLGEIAAAITDYEQSLPYYRQVDDRFYIAWTLKMLGTAYSSQGQHRQAVDLLQQSLQMFQELGISEYPVLVILAWSLVCLGDFEQAEAYGQRAYDVGQARDNQITGALTFMGELFLWQGEIEKAQTLILEALAIAEENNLEWRQLQAWKVLGIMANMQADYAQALHYLTQIQDRNPTMEWFKKSVEIWLGLTVYGLGQYGLARQHLVSGLRHRRVALDGLSLAALLFNQAGHPERATILLALAFHASQRGYTLVWGTKHPLVLRLKEALAEALPPDVFAAAWEQGQRLDLAETVTDLLTELEAEAKTANPNPRHTKRSEKHH